MGGKSGTASAPRAAAAPEFAAERLGSGGGSEREVEALGRQLVADLGLGGAPRLVGGDCAEGLRLEARHRRRFWEGEPDPLREALHRQKRSAYARAEREGTTARLVAAWRESGARADAAARARYRDLAPKLGGPDDAEYLRRMLRAWQQAYGRSARWRAVAPAGAANPFEALERLLRAGVWPLASTDAGLILFEAQRGRASAQAPEATSSPPRPPTPHGDASRRIFVSAEFRHDELGDAWSAALEAAGWTVQYGQVDERSEPPEPRLGRSIRASARVLGLLPEPDALLGLPWWNLQELDHAAAHRVPCAVALPPDGALPWLPPGCRVLPIDFRAPPRAAAPLWRWLEQGGQEQA